MNSKKSVNMNIGKSIKTALMYEGKTQTEMAKDLGLSRVQLNVHCNKEESSAPVVKRFADYFGMSVKEFIELGE